MKDTGAFITFAVNTESTAGHRVSGDEPSLIICPFELSLTPLGIKESMAASWLQVVPEVQRGQLTRVRK